MNINEQAIAERLLQINAVQLNVLQPYTWASGWKSPIYCDNRKILSYPYVRDFIKSELCNIIFEKYPETECLAGVATAGIAWGAMAADQLKLPFMYVRPKPKEHGMGNQIEGTLLIKQKCIVIEDLISTGNSSLQVCKVLIEAGVEVIGMISIFNYGFPESKLSFDNAGIELTSLTTYDILIKQAIIKGMVTESQLNTLLNWRNNPSEWKG